MGDSVHLVYPKPMGGKFGKGCLGEMNRDVAIVVAEPGECSAEKEVNISHEVNFDVLNKFALE